MKENLCIIGCGWLGQFVGKEISSHFENVYASYRSEETKAELDRLDFKSFKLDIEKDDFKIPADAVQNTRVLLISLPPFNRLNPEKYGDALARVASQFAAGTHIIFTSSTGFYPNENRTFDESYECSEANILCHAENELTRTAKERISVLRLGGLIGGKRHPIKFLSGKQMSNDGSEAVNLIHRGDIARLILHLLTNDIEAGILNVSYPLSMNKKSYYNFVAEKFDLPLPVWNSTPSVQRVISTDKLQKLKGFDLIFNPLEFNFE